MIRTAAGRISDYRGGRSACAAPINIVIRHMANGLLYIACLFRDFGLRSAAATAAVAFSSVRC